MRNLLILIIISIFSISCENWLSENSLPKGRGERGEIILVLDSSRWAGEIGSELRITYRELVDGLPRDEPMFDLKQIVPFTFKGILKHAKNIILVIPLDDDSNESKRMRNFFTESSLDSMRANEKIFIIKRKNLFATDQEVLFLIGHNDQLLKENIIKNRSYLQTHFDDVEEKRIYRNLFKIKEEKLISDKLTNEYGFDLRIPYGFEIAEMEDDFVWLRQAGLDFDKSLFVTFKEYTNEGQFEDKDIIEWRDEICKKYLYENKDNPNSNIITEPLDPPVIQEVNFENKYAKYIRGRWKTKNISMGGPFVSYVFVDEELNRLYYIEGFLYGPGVNQRELVRELNVILKTFNTKSEISG